MFCPKNHEPNFCYNITISLEVESPTFVSPEAPLQYWCVGVLQLSWFFVKIEATDNRSNFAETILFENGSCFSKIPYSISVESPRIFQCLISISAGHWVWQIDGHLPRRTFLSALLSLVISMTGRSKRSAKRCAMARTSCAVIGNEFCVRICYMMMMIAFIITLGETM